MLFKHIAGCFLLIGVFLLSCLLVNAQASQNHSGNKRDKPNIILIYADDLGYSDVGCYGRAYGNTFTETPNIDRLAKEGMKFTRAYAPAPLCSPSRASMLTGRSVARLNFEFVTKYEKDSLGWDDPKWIGKFDRQKLIPPPYTLSLPLHEITIAEVLKAQGYSTGISGKWHLAPHYKKYNGWNPVGGPSQQGFSWTTETVGAHPYGYEENGLPTVSRGVMPVDELTAKSIEFLKQTKDKPFFLFVSHHFVHTPVTPKIEWLLEKYRAKAAGKLSDQKIRYAAFVEMLDYYVGQLLQAIKDEHLEENTLVIFTSDNGGHPDFAYNRPFRGSKWNLYEGGIRVPFIARWPGVIEKGSTCNSAITQTDLMPTFREVALIKAKPEKELDGVSLMPLLKGGHNDVHRNKPLLWHFPYYHPEGNAFEGALSEIGIEDNKWSKSFPQSAIQVGKYKLIYFYEDERSELYDLSVDLAEQHDLSGSNPKETRKLKELLFAELKRVNARLPHPKK